MQASSVFAARDLARAASPNQEAVMSQGGTPITFRVQSEAKPGQSVSATGSVTVNTGTSLIPALGPGDTCSTGFYTTGADIELQLLVDGQVVDNKSACIDGTLDGTFRFTAPRDPGQYTVELRAVGVNTGDTYGSELRTLTVREDASGGGPPGGGGDNGGSGGLFSGALLPCFLDPNRDCGEAEFLIFAFGGGFLMLFLIAVAGAAF